MNASDVDLPPLPEANWAMPERMAGKWSVPGAWSADQMKAYALQAVLRERERCAKLADDMDYGMGELAAAIRCKKAE